MCPGWISLPAYPVDRSKRCSSLCHTSRWTRPLLMSYGADVQKRLVTANHTPTWWCNMSPLPSSPRLHSQAMFHQGLRVKVWPFHRFRPTFGPILPYTDLHLPTPAHTDPRMFLRLSYGWTSTQRKGVHGPNTSLRTLLASTARA